MKCLALELIVGFRDPKHVAHFIQSNTHESIMNTIDKEKEDTDARVVLKFMKLLIQIGHDQGSKLLGDAMGYHG